MSSEHSRWRTGMAKVMAATVVYGVLHSLLASLAAKHRASRWFGARNRNGLYRVFYILQSFVTFGVFARYAWDQPKKALYEVRGPAALAMHAGQAAAMVYAVLAARQVGVRRITGLLSLVSWLGSETPQPEPEAQGPALDGEGRRNALGPFAWSRHPLNFVPLPIFWLWPRMNTNVLGFNLVATVYLVLGSIHEEQRLRHAFPEDYLEYQTSGVPFFIPVPRRSPFRRFDQLQMGPQTGLESHDVMLEGTSKPGGTSGA